MITRSFAYALALVFCLSATYRAQGQITIRPPVRELSADGGGGYIITTGTGTWTAQTTADWISIQPRTSGEADESCIYVVRKNISTEPRDAQILINDNIHTVIQYGADSPKTSSSADQPDKSKKKDLSDKPKTVHKQDGGGGGGYDPPDVSPDNIVNASDYSWPASKPVATEPSQARGTSLKSESSYNPSSYSPATTKPIYSSPSGRFEARGGVNYYIPGGAAATGSRLSKLNSVDWERGIGADIQGIYWFDSNWGAGLSVGTAKWDIKDYYNKRYNASRRINEINTLEGDADLIIIGASVFYKYTSKSSVPSKWSTEIEGGIRSISVDSNIKGIYAEQYADGTIYGAQTIETDRGAVAMLAINGGYELTSQIKFSWQAGYQFDLSKGETKNKTSQWSGEAGETELQSMFTRLGLSITF